MISIAMIALTGFVLVGAPALAQVIDKADPYSAKPAERSKAAAAEYAN